MKTSSLYLVRTASAHPSLNTIVEGGTLSGPLEDRDDQSQTSSSDLKAYDVEPALLRLRLDVLERSTCIECGDI